MIATNVPYRSFLSFDLSGLPVTLQSTNVPSAFLSVYQVTTDLAAHMV